MYLFCYFRKNISKQKPTPRSSAKGQETAKATKFSNNINKNYILI